MLRQGFRSLRSAVSLYDQNCQSLKNIKMTWPLIFNVLNDLPEARVGFKKIVKRYIRVGYNLDSMRQSACLVLSPITVYSYGFLFNYTMVGQASDSRMALT